MIDPFSLCRGRAAALVVAALGLAAIVTEAAASRVGGAAPPPAEAVQAAAQEPAHVQADESASLRQGTVGALDARGARVQVQGVWIELVAGKTQLIRSGRAAGLETLKAGESIRFAVVPGSGAAPAMKVIYAP